MAATDNNGTLRFIGFEPDATISLYFDLKEDENVELESAARAAIAFSQMVRQIAAHVDLGTEVRIELESGTEGSLSLNAIVKWVRGFAKKHPTLSGIVISSLIMLRGDVRGWTVEKILDFMTGGDAPAIVLVMSDKDKEDIAAQVAKLLSQDVAEKEREALFRELQRDSAIIGIGGTGEPGKRPDTIVPRERFSELAGGLPDPEPEPLRRVVTSRVRATLVRPRLKAEIASWRFQIGGFPEFSAEMRDRDFLQALSEDRVSLPLKVGTEMEIEIETEETFDRGIWIPTRRFVTRVFNPPVSPPPSLFDEDNDRHD